MRKIAVINQKGGVAKTTTSLNLAAVMAKLSKKVLLIDMDSQGNISNSLKIKPEKTISEVLVGDIEYKDALMNLRENIDIILSDDRLAGAELIIGSQPRREEVLKRRLKDLEGYDFVFVDCAPSLSLANQNSLTFVDEIIIPLNMDDLSISGASKVIRTILSIREIFDHEIKDFLLVPTMFDSRTRVTKDCYEFLKDNFPGKVSLPIRLNTKFREATNHGKTILEYESDLLKEKKIKEPKGTHDYFKLAKWVLEGPFEREEGENEQKINISQ